MEMEKGLEYSRKEKGGERMKVKEKFLKTERWHVKIYSKENRSSIIPYGNYIWLKHNPSFKEIPKGYVIHHLDHDKQNDDISNLALMQRYHHTAHHFKNKIIETEVKFTLKGIQSGIKMQRSIYAPRTEPRISEYRKGKYRLRFQENLNGTSQKTYIYSWDDRPITSIEMAQKIKDKIWSNSNVAG